MRRDRLPLAAGLTPVFLVTAPTALAGALQLKRNSGGVWESLASLMITLCTFVQGGAMCLAMYYVEDVLANQREKVNKYADFSDVKVKAEP